MIIVILISKEQIQANEIYTVCTSLFCWFYCRL